MNVVNVEENAIILSGVVTSDDKVLNIESQIDGSKAYLTGDVCSTPEAEEIVNATNEVIESWGIDAQEDVVIITDAKLVADIDAEIEAKLNS